MKKITLLTVLCLCLFLLPLSASAAGQQSTLDIQAVAASNGSCQVSISATIYKQDNGQLSFPIPKEATSITLNGASVRTKAIENARLIDLSAVYGTTAGRIVFTVHYTLRDVISKTSFGTQQLQLPLLCGFDYRIDILKFSLTLPGEITAKPAFQSGYHQSNIEKDITYSLSGSTLTGQTEKALIDHETLYLTLHVPDTMFPKPMLKFFTSDIDSIGIAVCALLAFVYWLWKLRCLPPRRKFCTTLPEGSNAGQLGTVLGLQNANLTRMVFSWAQLGYIYIKPKKDRVLLYKHMEMGNERTDFEQHCFHRLFAKGDTVDCSGYRYALQCQKVAHTQPPLSHLVDKRCGNRKVFRLLTVLCGLFSGLGLGLSLGFGGILQPLFALVFAILGCYTAAQIQNWAGCLFLYNRQQLITSTLLALIWLFLSMLAGRLVWGLLFVALEFIAGLLGYYGGRRTEDGRQAVAQILGFRRYLRRVSRQELDAISRRNPDYFFDLAPYALALGVGRAFARQFGTKPFRECPYIEVPLKDTITAAKWNKLMEETLDKMESNQRKASVEQFSRRIKRLIK